VKQECYSNAEVKEAHKSTKQRVSIKSAIFNSVQKLPKDLPNPSYETNKLNISG